MALSLAGVDGEGGVASQAPQHLLSSPMPLSCWPHSSQERRGARLATETRQSPHQRHKWRGLSLRWSQPFRPAVGWGWGGHLCSHSPRPVCTAPGRPLLRADQSFSVDLVTDLSKGMSYPLLASPVRQ